MMTKSEFIRGLGVKTISELIDMLYNAYQCQHQAKSDNEVYSDIVDSLNADISGMYTRIAELESESAYKSNLIKKLDRKNNSLNNDIEGMSKRIAELESENAKLGKMCQEYNEHEEYLNTVIECHSKELEKMCKQNDDLNARVRGMSGLIKRLDGENAELKEDNEGMEKRIEELEQKYSPLEEYEIVRIIEVR